MCIIARDCVLRRMEQEKKFAAPAAKVRQVWALMTATHPPEDTPACFEAQAVQVRQVIGFLHRSGRSEWSEHIRRSFDQLIQAQVDVLHQLAHGTEHRAHETRERSEGELDGGLMGAHEGSDQLMGLSLIHISEPTRPY
eukprot:TRINITY_DN23775_c0_g1_i1.p1 TRINITY_DN23775_c0_g1~~TRINITY_DN23775_c0_g1_i1.p1  ORF type:complete len:139 (+),score=19.00 TRINITY_DN23775_c0_g1_i1:182-598(+)